MDHAAKVTVEVPMQGKILTFKFKLWDSDVENCFNYRDVPELLTVLGNNCCIKESPDGLYDDEFEAWAEEWRKPRTPKVEKAKGGKGRHHK